MGKAGKPGTGSTVERAVRAVAFVHAHRTWTIEDLAEHLGLHRNNARQYLAALSMHLPIMQVRPPRYGQGGHGRMAGLYGMVQTRLKGGSSGDNG